MKLHKSEVARRQLEQTFQLLLSGGDTLSIITLAGAAEEVLGNLLRRAGHQAMLDDLIELDRHITGGREFEVVNREVNGLRNALITCQ